VSCSLVLSWRMDAQRVTARFTKLTGQKGKTS
jgi:hypothetical protein